MPLQSGDIIVLATDGLFDNIFEEEIAAILTEKLRKGKSLQVRHRTVVWRTLVR